MSYGSRRLRDYTRASGFVQTIPVYPDGTLQWAVFDGVLSTNTLPSAATVLSQFARGTATQIGGTYTFSGAIGKYLFICVPKYFGLITSFSGPITAWTLLTPSPAIVNGVGDTGNSVTDVPLEVNVDGVLTHFNVYVSNTTSATDAPSITVT